jgi:hypothetical protein
MDSTSNLNNSSTHSNQDGSDDGSEGKVPFIYHKQ